MPQLPGAPLAEAEELAARREHERVRAPTRHRARAHVTPLPRPGHLARGAIATAATGAAAAAAATGGGTAAAGEERAARGHERGVRGAARGQPHLQKPKAAVTSS